MHLAFSAYQFNLQHMVKELEDNIGISFAELLDCKDHNVAGHVLRTGEYAALLAKELHEAGTFGNEITEEFIDMLKRATLFHDVGKIGVSDLILLKRSSLTEEETREVQSHPLIGGRVLRAIYDRTPDQHYLEMAISIAESHHEFYDGTGYPKGIKGDDIPLCCRIIAVANVYDSCTTDRVYRRALSHDETCEVILKGSGTKFDPRVVDAFNKISNSFPSFKISPSTSYYRSDMEIFQ
jgi:putative two-component system response regulator